MNEYYPNYMQITSCMCSHREVVCTKCPLEGVVSRTAFILLRDFIYFIGLIDCASVVCVILFLLFV